MTAARWDEPTAKALAHLIAKLRPAWDTPGILTAIHLAYGRHHDLATVAHIAIDAATDLTAQTPAVITHRDRTTTAQPPARTPEPPQTGRICHTCAQVHTPPDAPCHRPADETTAKAGLDAARQALQDGRDHSRIPVTEEDVCPF